jgi:hypothetical protein
LGSNSNNGLFLDASLLGDPEALFNVFKTLALADLDKRLANIDREIKARLR